MSPTTGRVLAAILVAVGLGIGSGHVLLPPLETLETLGAPNASPDTAQPVPSWHRTSAAVGTLEGLPDGTSPQLPVVSTCGERWRSGQGGAVLYVPDLGVSLEDLRAGWTEGAQSGAPCLILAAFPGSGGGPLAADSVYASTYRSDLLGRWLDAHASRIGSVVLHGYGSVMLQAFTAHSELPLLLVDPYGTGSGILLGEASLNETALDLQQRAYGVMRWVFPHYRLLTDPYRLHDRVHSLGGIRFDSVRSAWASIGNPTRVVFTGGNSLSSLRVLPDLPQTSSTSIRVLSASGAPGGLLPMRFAPDVALAARLLSGAGGGDVDGVVEAPAEEVVARMDARSREATGSARVFFMLLLIVMTIVSEDLAMVAAGILAANGTLGLGWAVAAGWLGVMTFDIPIYLSGRLLGRPAMSRPPIRWFLSARSVQLAERWTQRWGAWGLYLSRLVPGSRFPVYFMAGALGMGPLRYIVNLAIAGLLSAAILVTVAAKVGRDLLDWVQSSSLDPETVRNFALAIALVYLLSRLLSPYFRYKSSEPPPL